MAESHSSIVPLTSQHEEWYPIPGWEEYYEVSSIGRVRTKHKIGAACRKKILAQSANSKGYLRVRLTSEVRTTTSVVHRLVLFAFVGPCPVGHECNHKNAVKCDNRVENLEWVTPRENNQHAVSLGLWSPHKGEAHGRAVLTETDIKAIRSEAGGPHGTQARLAKKYGVAGVTIQRIWLRRLWKHVL